ncbi:MAG: hypothetical protein D6798_04470, partial [Deltaproteobacteria bacterium]
RTPVPPHELNPDVPLHLEEICLRLLAKSPRDRFQSAREVLEELLADDPDTDTDASPGIAVWSPPLVGREDVLGAAREALARLTRSAGGVLLLEGAEGSGRSRALEAVSMEARARGLPVYSVRFNPGEAAFAGLLRLARDIGRELGSDVPPELARAVARFAEGRGRLPGDARYQLFDGIRTALATLLERGPQVLALDDLHAAPGPLIDLLGYLVRSLVSRDGQPLLVVAAVRAEPPRTDPSEVAPRRTGNGYAAFRRGRDLGLVPEIVPLRPLRVDHIETITASLLGPGQAASALARRLQEATNGDPLFVVEFIRSLMQRDIIVSRDHQHHVLTISPTELTPERLGVPPGLRQAVRERLGVLPDDSRVLLEVIAVAAREIDLDVVLDVVELIDSEQTAVIIDDAGAGSPAAGSAEHPEAPLDPDLPTEDLPTEVAPEADTALHDIGGSSAIDDRWMDALDRLIAEGIVEEQRDGLSTTVRLAQRQVGEVVCDDLPERAMATLHRRIAAALEVRFADSPIAAEAIGEHYRRAGDAVRAWTYLVRATVGLLERSLMAEAASLLDRARAIQDLARASLSRDQEQDFQLQSLELDEVEAELLFNRGEWDAAGRALDNLRRRAAALGQHGMAARASIKYGTTLRRMGRLGEGEAEIRKVLDRARKRHERDVELSALQALAGIAWSRGDLDACEALASQGLLGPADPDLAEGRAGILLALSTVQASKGQLAAAIAGLAEAEELLRGLRDKRTRANVLVNLSEMLTWKGDLAAACARAEEALSLSRDLVYRVVEASALRARAIALIAIGDKASARLDLRQGLAIARDLGINEEVVPMRFHLARVAILDGQADKAEEHLTAARAAAMHSDPESFSPAIDALLSMALARQGHEDAARQVLAGATAQRQRLHAPRRTELSLLLGHAHLALGDTEAALPMIRDAARTASTFHFRSWGLLAWSLLAQHAPEPESDRARRTGAAIAREILATLPPSRANYFRRQPAVVRLLGMPLL